MGKQIKCKMSKKKVFQNYDYKGSLSLCYVLSPSPWDASILSWRSGRSATLSPWQTKASFRILGPLNTTIHFWPSRKLNTSPYVSANWKWMWHRWNGVIHHMTKQCIALIIDLLHVSILTVVDVPSSNSHASCGGPDCICCPQREVPRVLEGI